jgi:hypothetical protein
MEKTKYEQVNFQLDTALTDEFGKYYNEHKRDLFPGISGRKVAANLVFSTGLKVCKELGSKIKDTLKNE